MNRKAGQPGFFIKTNHLEFFVYEERIGKSIRPANQNVLAREAYMQSALYAIARPSVRPSVRLSVTGVYHTKTVEVRVMKFSPYAIAPSLWFLRGKFYIEILTGSPERGR